MTATIGNAIDWWVDRAPGRLAISIGGEKATYAELGAWVDRIAERLSEEGVGPGDRAGIYAGNSLSWCAAALAIIKTGAVMVPLNYRYTPSELASVVADCSPKLMISDVEREARVQSLVEAGYRVLPMATISGLREGPARPFKRELDPTAPVVIAYTSGSTALPKGVVFTHQTMLAYAFESSLLDPHNHSTGRTLGVAPLYTGAGIITLVQFMVLGMTAFLTAEFDPAEALKTLIEEKVDSFGGVPTFFERIAAVPGFEQADLSHIKLASTGGARVSRALLEKWLKRGVVLRQLYGLTEGGGSTSTMDIEGAIEFPEKCGAGGPFTKHRVVDPDGKDCPPNTPGEIILKGPAMMIGYWNNPKATEAVFTEDGWLRTGDIGTLDELGRITVVDRLKDIIISGGLNISPIDVEQVISQLDGVVEVAVIAAADERFGETPMAIVHARTQLDVSAVIAHCNVHLANYKVPRYLVFEPEALPKLPTGKISKRALKEKYKDAASQLQRVR